MTDYLSDPLCIPDTIVQGIGRISLVGESCIRFTFYAIHNGEFVVVAKIVWPGIVAAMRANKQVRAFFDDQIRHLN